MAALEPAYERTVIGNEGPYDNDPKDPGGETVFGITRKYQASWPGWVRFDSMRSMLTTRAAIVSFVKEDEQMQRCILEFYEKGPWAAIRGSEMDSQKVAEEIFDSGVNCGMVMAIKWLQRALNVFNRQGADYPDIEVDGYMGNQTLECLNALIKRRGDGLILKALNALQGVRYIEIAERNPNLEQFEAGWWANRVS